MFADGYGSNWNIRIRIEYSRTSFLSFDYLIDSEGGFDFLSVDEDLACASFSRVDYSVAPSRRAGDIHGTPTFQASGFNVTPSAATHVDSLPLTPFGARIHCAYISFTSDGSFSPQDGRQASTIGVVTVVDNIQLTGGTTLTETFTGAIDNPLVISFVSLLDREPFGIWTRTHHHITDSDVCTENATCALLSTDVGSLDGNPTPAVTPAMAFAPGGFVIRNWLDDMVISPWASLASTDFRESPSPPSHL